MLLAGSAPLIAHHSFSAFNTETEKTIAGVVNRFEWTNPHTWIWVDVQENGKTVTWGVEGMSPNYLSRRGWSKKHVQAGRQSDADDPSDARRFTGRHVHARHSRRRQARHVRGNRAVARGNNVATHNNHEARPESRRPASGRIDLVARADAWRPALTDSGGS
jgi:hypothetical protein